MVVAVEPLAMGSGSSPKHGDGVGLDEPRKQQRVRVRRRTLQTVLEQCQSALELLKNADVEDPVDGDEECEEKDEDGRISSLRTSSSTADSETDKFCDLLKSRVDSPSFLEKLGSIHMSISQNTSDENTSWDVVTATDLWDDKFMDEGNGSDQDDYVLVRQEDIVDGVACFMAAYLLSLEQAKDLTPNQLQDALSKTFSVKKKKGKLQKAWDGSKVIYNVASWGATAIGIYQNPALIGAASAAFWTSCRVVSKLF